MAPQIDPKLQDHTDKRPIFPESVLADNQPPLADVYQTGTPPGGKWHVKVFLTGLILGGLIAGSVVGYLLYTSYQASRSDAEAKIAQKQSEIDNLQSQLNLLKPQPKLPVSSGSTGAY
jgi:hypothetical protein